MIILAGDECQALPRLDQESMVAVGSRQLDPRDDPVIRGVNLDELLASLNVHEDVLGDRVVLRVSDVSTERDRRDSGIRPHIDHSLRVAVLVRHV